MGHGLSLINETWSSEELEKHEKNEKINQLQQDAIQFISKNIYYEVPFRIRRKYSTDPRSTIWIEPSPKIVDKSFDDVC
jgi:hypothetical protein